METLHLFREMEGQQSGHQKVFPECRFKLVFCSPVTAELVVVVEPLYLLRRHQLREDHLGLYRSHGHRLECQEDALARHREPCLGPHHLDQGLDPDAEVAVLVVSGLV